MQIPIRFPTGITPESALTVSLHNTNMKLRLINSTIKAKPAGITFTNSLLNVESSGNIADADGDNTTDTVSFNFGDVQMRNPGVEDSRHTVIIEVVAVVLNVAASSQGSNLVNRARFTFGTSPAVDAQLQLTVSEPVLVQSASWNATSGNAGDVIQCTVRVSHDTASRAPALFADMFVQLPSQMTLLQGITSSIASSAPQNASISAPWQALVGISRLPRGDTWTVTFNVLLTATVVAGTTLPSSVTSFYTSAVPASLGRNYQIAPTPLVLPILPIPSSVFALGSKSDPHIPFGYVSQGERVTFFVNITVPRGITLNPQVTVNVSTASGLLEITSVAIDTLANNIVTSGFAVATSDTNADTHNDTAIITFASIVNNPSGAYGNQVVVLVSATVVTSPLNKQGVVLRTDSKFSFSNGTSTFPESSQTVNLSTVQPVLDWDVKWNATTGDAGDVVACAITIKHNVASTAVAWNIDIALLAPFYDVVSSSVNSSDSTFTPFAYSKDGYYGIIHLPYLSLDNTVTVVFNSVLKNSLLASSTLSTASVANYSSASTNGLTWSLNSSSILVVLPTPDSELGQYNSSNPDTRGSLVAIGEEMTYNVSITLPEGTTRTPTVVIQLPANLVAVTSHYILWSPANFDISTCVTTLSRTDMTATSNDTVTFACDFIINKPDNVFDKNDTIVIAVIAQVLPAAQNIDGKTLTVTSKFSYRNSTALFEKSVLSSTITVVVPVLQWTATWNRTSGQAGDVVGCSIAIIHSSTSTGPAYDIDITALLLPFWNLITGTIVTSDSNSYAAASVPSGWTGITHIPSLQLGLQSIISFSTVLDKSLLASSTVQNQLVASYWTTPGSFGRSSYLNRYFILFIIIIIIY